MAANVKAPESSGRTHAWTMRVDTAAGRFYSRSRGLLPSGAYPLYVGKNNIANYLTLQNPPNSNMISISLPLTVSKAACNCFKSPNVSGCYIPSVILSLFVSNDSAKSDSSEEGGNFLITQRL